MENSDFRIQLYAEYHRAGRLMETCRKYPISFDEVADASEFIALCTHYGIQPKELLAAGIKHFAHPELVDKLEEFFPDG